MVALCWRDKKVRLGAKIKWAWRLDLLFSYTTLGTFIKSPFLLIFLNKASCVQAVLCDLLKLQEGMSFSKVHLQLLPAKSALVQPFSDIPPSRLKPEEETCSSNSQAQSWLCAPDVKRRTKTQSMKSNLPNCLQTVINVLCVVFFPAILELFFKVNFAFRVHNPMAINIFVSTSSRCGWAWRASDTNQTDVQAPSGFPFRRTPVWDLREAQKKVTSSHTRKKFKFRRRIPFQMLEKRDGNSIVIVSTDNWNLGDISTPMITLRYMIVYVVH